MDFTLEAFFYELVIGIDKFYKLYLYMWVGLRKWSAILWDSLNTKYIRFKSSIAVAMWLIA